MRSVSLEKNRYVTVSVASILDLGGLGGGEWGGGVVLWAPPVGPEGKAPVKFYVLILKIP